MQELTKEQSIEILIQVANLAQSKGILQLNEAAVVAQAVEVLSKKQEQVELLN